MTGPGTNDGGEQPILQPPPDDGTSPGDLEDDGPEEAARRRDVDIAVAAALRNINYDLGHKIAQVMVERLQQTGAGLLIHLWKRHELFPRCRRQGLSLPLPPPSWPTEASSLLAAAAVEAAPKFVTTKLSIWRPDRNASIITYYTNYTLMYNFKTMYCAYCREEHRRQLHESEYNETMLSRDVLYSGVKSLDDVLNNRLIAEAEPHMDVKTKKIFDLIGKGSSQQDIAEAMNVHPRTIRRGVTNFQKRLRTQGWTAEDGAR